MYTTLRRFFLPLMWILTATSVPVFADDLTFTGGWTQTWANFGVSPYTAVDHTYRDKTVHILCLDFNDDIFPNESWQATIRPLTETNVTNYAQFGGNYPDIPTITADPSPYTRYLEAAWLFSNIEQAPKAQTAIIYQVAAWTLFVEAGPNQSTLQSDIGNTGIGLDVQNALDAAQTAIAHNWATSKYFGTWDIVTADKTWVDSPNGTGGRDVQEFLSYDAPVPEPAAVFLFGTVLVGVAIMIRRKLA